MASSSTSRRCMAGSEVLTAYVMTVIHEAGWTLPSDVRRGWTQGLPRFVEGHPSRAPSLPTADLSIRKLAALEALSRHGKATPRLLGSVTIEPNLWPTSAVLDWWTSCPAPEDPAAGSRARDEAEQIVRARLDLQGTTLGFSTQRRDALWWLMVSPDSDAVASDPHVPEAGCGETTCRGSFAACSAGSGAALGPHGRQCLGHARR